MAWGNVAGSEVEERLTVRRLPPDPLTITVDAVPANLAVLRARLREWLTQAAVEAEAAADVMLAVGEATANAAEHAPAGVAHEVRVTISIALVGSGLEVVVSDNGRWKPAAAAPAGYRGHGLKLIGALLDSHAVTTTEDGTAVTMRKELAP